jgi:hypothetical protein
MRGINLGNSLDAPRDGAWGVVLNERHFAMAAAAGLDHVRLPVRFSAHADDGPPYAVDEDFFQRVDWASYFDEGVFGNYGWSNPGPSAIGTPGLLAFSTAGQVCFSYDAEAAHTDAICDAYAMNVAGEDDVWLYFYTEFPIVRIRSGAYHVWKLGVGGARALAVDRNRALLFGDYERRALARLVDLGRTGVGKVTGELVLVDDRGESLADVVAWGVGRSLFFVTERRVLAAEGW